jgi:hypothetical protein
MVIIFKAESMVASKAMSEPLELVVLRVIKLSTLESVNAELSIFLTASLNVSVILESMATPVAEFAGLQVSVGAAVSATVKVEEAALFAVPHVFSTEFPIAT